MKDLYRLDPDSELDFDGTEETEDMDDVYRRDWEVSTWYW